MFYRLGKSYPRDITFILEVILEKKIKVFSLLYGTAFLVGETQGRQSDREVPAITDSR